MARHRLIVSVLTWNLFHGRDAPPDPALLTGRSRLTGRVERGTSHVQVNRSLRSEFAAALAAEEWDVALLQEAPPRWFRHLCVATRASGALALTARNLGAPLRAPVAERRPDLLASWEGGSNQTLVRPPLRIADVRRMTLTLRPERRRMLWTLLEAGTGDGGSRVALAVANLHASISGRGPEQDVERAAARADAWAGKTPLVFGGDLNLRPRDSPESFRRLEWAHGLAATAGDDCVDHVLGRAIELLGPPQILPAARREVPVAEGSLVRLSDHAPVIARFGIG